MDAFTSHSIPLDNLMNAFISVEMRHLSSDHGPNIDR